MPDWYDYQPEDTAEILAMIDQVAKFMVEVRDHMTVLDRTIVRRSLQVTKQRRHIQALTRELGHEETATDSI